MVLDVRALDGFCRAQFELIARELEGTCDVWAATHVARRGGAARRARGRTVEIDDRDIFAGLDHAKDVSLGLVPGNCDLKFLAATRALPGYARYVWWEYDVVCTRGIGDSVRRLLEETGGCDFAGSYLSDDHGDGWMWWPSFHAPVETRRHRAFLPLFVASRRFALGYAGLLASGWRGHSEVTLPSAARHLGMATLDLARLPSDFTRWPQFTALEPEGMDVEGEPPPRFVHAVKGFAQLAGYDLPECRLADVGRGLLEEASAEASPGTADAVAEAAAVPAGTAG